MHKRILVTGGAGFVGVHLIEHILKATDWDIVTLDRLDTSGNINRLTDIDIWEENKHRVTFLFHDLRAAINDQLGKQIGHIDYIVHLAAMTHVDRSIVDPVRAVEDNVLGTVNMLEYARSLGELDRMLYFSTDEVFGTAPEGVYFDEWARYNSGNPYSATKAGAEELCLAYHNTYKLPVFITHTMNIFGERQHPEKFIPLVIGKVLRGETVCIHSSRDKKKAGSRHYLHARNVSAAVMFLLENAEMGEKYNIVGEKESDNLELAKLIAGFVGKELKYEMVDFHSSRPGHDLRYALSGDKLKNMGFVYPTTLEGSLKKTIEWYLQHPEWLNL